MKQYTYTSRGSDETISLGEKIAKLFQPGDVITLEGDLGAGKTHFTKGVAKELEVKRVVNSPTFTIIKEYSGRIPLYHMDVYRLEHSDEDLGFDEYFNGQGVTVIEWASIIEEQLPEERLDIVIRIGIDGERSFIFTPRGDRYDLLCKEFETQ
ncbi:tRNA (adenosine(37)-N6)-threonylcarbamoyltransferase complex ATPase subunit type 1 TsaE [Bacillus alkalicellulosilyticus]|uniref:tRNA (adenosine(37)-N6)-threonylcarbamoyltransferase complex ATPase subunit type 1 TsaE n=1 Tax=Alkalihalobacterium alkalicellulosilyticum TaxID=1912214 RepID=UPI0009981655|nr:tRNA (adenosine(37)-N6)-threonylcarbamoyltransferase complex ATPase subunit type 1 TsaE [Bacillus alkalicellulosilyticus]